MVVAKRIIKNTVFLYIKMGITVFISLYTTRIVLNALGVTDYGIFAVIGGSIALLGFFKMSMAKATQRFMSFYQGKGIKEIQLKIFNITLVLHFFLALFFGVLLLIAGLFIFDGILNIPTERIYAAKIVYGALIISVIFNIIAVPYDAILNAHENMLYYSIVGIFESILKLFVALFIVKTSQDKLVIYGILMSIIPFITFIIMRVYCHKKYQECKLAIYKYWDRALMLKIMKFGGWSLMSTSASMITEQGQVVLFNVFFGPSVNSAHVVITQISGQLGALSNNMQKAINPVIVKSEGDQNKVMVKKVSFTACKLSYMLLGVFAIPLIFETSYFLKLWLINVPPYSIIFLQLILIKNLVEQIARPLHTVITSTGNIKELSVSTSTLFILALIASYFLLKNSFPPQSIYFILLVVASVISLIIYPYFIKKINNISSINYFKEVIFRCIIATIIATLLAFIPYLIIEEGLIRIVSVFLVFSSFFLLSSYFIILETQERNFIKGLFMNKLNFNA